jgi:PHD/YefM family antitoxin component YafN of YafNO toxin-antitoxin module
MKTIDITQSSSDVADLLEQARHEDLVVRLADGSEFLLIAVDEFDREIAKSRNNPRLMALLESRARQTETVPWDEVKRRLGL